MTNIVDIIKETLDDIRPYKIKRVKLKHRPETDSKLNACYNNALRAVNRYDNAEIKGGWCITDYYNSPNTYRLVPHYWIQHKYQYIDPSNYTSTMERDTTTYGYILDPGILKYIEQGHSLLSNPLPPPILFCFMKDKDQYTLGIENDKEAQSINEAALDKAIAHYERTGKALRVEHTRKEETLWLVDKMLTNKTLAMAQQKYNNKDESMETIQRMNNKIRKYNKVYYEKQPTLVAD